MTRQKAFKHLVRERMAKTGERYAAARRALDTNGPSPTPEPASVDGYRLLGGVHPEIAALRNLLASRGLALTEAQVLGIGGGLGAGYILWQFDKHGSAFLTLGFTNRWQYPVAAIETTTRRLGLDAEILETGGVKRARTQLDDLLGAGEPVLAFVDPEGLGLWGLPPAMSGYVGSQVVVFGRAPDGAYLIDDRGRAPFHVDPDTMARARGRIPSYKHRLVRIPTPVAGIDPAQLRRAYADGLADQIQHLRSSSTSFGLPAWRAWSRMLLDDRNVKGWRRVFGDRVDLFGMLVSVVEAVDGSVGATGGHLRDLYADFLEDAAAVLDRPGLLDAAVRWREAADLWEDFADAAVPAGIADLSRAVDAAEELREAARQGEPGRTRAREAAARLWDLRRAHASGAGIDASAVEPLFRDLSARLAQIYAVEVRAVEATAAGAGG